MKRIIVMFSLAGVLILMSCGNEKPAEVKKEVIVVPSSPTIITNDPPKKPTSISLDKNGVKVETRKVDVSVKKQ